MALGLVKILAGDFTTVQVVSRRTGGLFSSTRVPRLIVRCGVFGSEKLDFEDIASLDVFSRDNAQSLLRAAGWGLAGDLMLGPAGLLAGLIGGAQATTQVTFQCVFKDGRKFLGQTGSATYNKFVAALWSASNGIARRTVTGSKGGLSKWVKRAALCWIAGLAVLIIHGEILERGKKSDDIGHPTSSAPTPSHVDGTSARKGAKSAKVQRLIEKEEAFNATCRGGSGDSPETMAACDKRDNVLKQIQSMGWCWGPDDAIEADKDWVRCNASN